jgi:hypothetical protein
MNIFKVAAGAIADTFTNIKTAILTCPYGCGGKVRTLSSGVQTCDTPGCPNFRGLDGERIYQDRKERR